MKKCILKVIAIILCVNVTFLQAPLCAADFLATTDSNSNQQAVSIDQPNKTNSDLVVGASESQNELNFSGGALSSAAAPVVTAAAQEMLSDEELDALFSELENARAIERIADAAVKAATEIERLAAQEEALARDANRQASNAASSATSAATSPAVVAAVTKAEAAEAKATEVWQKALDAVNKAKAELKSLEDQMAALFINRRTGAVIAFDQLSAASQKLYRSLKSDYLAKEKSIGRLEGTLEKKLDLKNSAIQKTRDAKIYLDIERDAKAALEITTANLAAKTQLRIHATAKKIEKMTPHEAAKADVRVIENALIANSRKMGLNTPVLTNVEEYKSSLEKHVKDEEFKKKLLEEYNRRLSDQFKVPSTPYYSIPGKPSPLGGPIDQTAKRFAELLEQQLGVGYKVHYQFEGDGPVLFFDVKKLKADGEPDNVVTTSMGKRRYDDVLTFRATTGSAVDSIVVIPEAMHMRRMIQGGSEGPYPELHAGSPSAGASQPEGPVPAYTEPDMTYSIYSGILKLMRTSGSVSTMDALTLLITSPINSVERVKFGTGERVIVTLTVSGQKQEISVGVNPGFIGVPGVIYWQYWKTPTGAQNRNRYNFISINPAKMT